jgi:hypothetical protein
MSEAKREQRAAKSAAAKQRAASRRAEIEALNPAVAMLHAAEYRAAQRRANETRTYEDKISDALRARTAQTEAIAYSFERLKIAVENEKQAKEEHEAAKESIVSETLALVNLNTNTEQRMTNIERRVEQCREIAISSSGNKRISAENRANALTKDLESVQKKYKDTYDAAIQHLNTIKASILPYHIKELTAKHDRMAFKMLYETSTISQFDGIIAGTPSVGPTYSEEKLGDVQFTRNFWTAFNTYCKKHNPVPISAKSNTEIITSSDPELNELLNFAVSEGERVGHICCEFFKHFISKGAKTTSLPTSLPSSVFAT